MFGGRSGSDSFSSTAESLDPASLSWGLYDDLAMPGGSSFFQHCMVKVNDSLAFMAGGYKDGVDTYSDEAYLLDLVRAVQDDTGIPNPNVLKPIILHTLLHLRQCVLILQKNDGKRLITL